MSFLFPFGKNLFRAKMLLHFTLLPSAAFFFIHHRCATHVPGGKQQLMAAQKGDTVQVHYTGKTTDGEVFDSSQGRAPLEFEVGAGQMIPGFDRGVEGMEVGDKKTIHIPALDGYGEWSDQNVVAFPKEQVPPDMQLEVGQQLQLQSDSGMPIQVTVVELLPDSVLLDANHFLAGEDLIFDVEMVDVKSKSRIIMP
jgi:FKBP-type peptidyl-prolyl cis-trans isomerase 2